MVNLSLLAARHADVDGWAARQSLSPLEYMSTNTCPPCHDLCSTVFMILRSTTGKGLKSSSSATGGLQRRFRCDLCQTTYKRKADLIRHLNVGLDDGTCALSLWLNTSQKHDGIVPITCQRCTRRFACRASQQKHRCDKAARRKDIG